MYTLEITLQRREGNNWPVVAQRNRPEALMPVRDEGYLQLDQEELLSQTTPKDYGVALGKALFRDDVRDAFVAARTESDGRLRVLLSVEDVGLRTLRWERLCAPLDGDWRFLELD